MSLDLANEWFLGLRELRHAATPKRLRARLDGTLVVDTREAFLVWEPTRIVPQYAVPEAALQVDLVELSRSAPPDDLPHAMGPQHFELHTCPGTPLAPAAGPSAGVEVGFRPDDEALGGRVILDFPRFEWLEEDEPVMGHPHDPFKRIDVLRSDRHVVVSLDGTVLAESHRAMALFETWLPVRWYLPREDVRLDLLQASQTHTVCAYKGVASYLSAEGSAGADIAWYYPDPLHDAEQVRDLVAFWSERAHVTADGEPMTGGMMGPAERHRS